MPFDTTFKPAVVEPSLDGLIAWLETQDPKTEYCCLDNGNCLLHQFFRGIGIPMPKGCGIGGYTWHRADDCVSRPLPADLRAVSRGRPRTFGAALERARMVRAG